MSHTLFGGEAVFVCDVLAGKLAEETTGHHILCVYCSWSSINKCVIDTVYGQICEIWIYPENMVSLVVTSHRKCRQWIFDFAITILSVLFLVSSSICQLEWPYLTKFRVTPPSVTLENDEYLIMCCYVFTDWVVLYFDTPCCHTMSSHETTFMRP